MGVGLPGQQKALRGKANRNRQEEALIHLELRVTLLVGSSHQVQGRLGGMAAVGGPTNSSDAGSQLHSTVPRMRSQKVRCDAPQQNLPRTTHVPMSDSTVQRFHISGT